MLPFRCDLILGVLQKGPTNFSLMAYSSTSSNNEVSTNSNYSSSYLENIKILKEQNEQLLKDLRTSKLNAIAYKIGLESVEARLLVYKKNKSVYEEDIKLTVENFENSSKILSKLIDCQIVDKCKTGLGYNVVPPPYTGKFMPPKSDLSFSGLEEFMNEPIVSEPTVKKLVVETSEAKASAAKPKYDCDNHQRQFNNKKMVKPVWNYTQRVNHQNFSRMTHPSPKSNMVPKAVLMRSCLVSLTTARPVNTAQPRTTVNSERPMTNVFNKAHSTVGRPINNKTATKNSNFNQKINTVRPKAVLNAVKGN
ncbi:hypothetical protein Tco_0513413 [Tanacetum coccineum]